MSVLVFTENWDGKFKKLSFELVSYAAAIAKELGSGVTAISIGGVSDDELSKLGNYGATKVLNVADDRFLSLDNKALSKAIAHAAEVDITIADFDPNPVATVSGCVREQIAHNLS